MNSRDELERTIGDLRIATEPALDERILADATAALARLPRENVVQTPRRFPGWARLAAAAGIVVVLGVLLALPGRVGPAAYALEHTLEANRALESFHARMTTETEHGRETAEIWMEIDEAGELLRLRQELSQAEGGPKTVVWQDGRAEVWFEPRNMVVLIEEPGLPDLVEQIRAQVDPRVSMQFLHDAEAAGRLEVRTIQPAGQGDPIRLMVTRPDDPTWMYVYLIDPETSLLTREESHVLHDGAQRRVSRTEYLEYNQPIDPGVFALDLPDDVTIVDQVQHEVGLAQGDLADDEVAVLVARTFLEAWRAGDLARAGMLLEGLPAERMPEILIELFGAEECAAIVSIGTVVRDSQYDDTAFLCVPCTVEVIVEGEIHQVRRDLGIRHVHNRADRWTVAGTCDD